jgi:hypothetical protein
MSGSSDTIDQLCQTFGTSNLAFPQNEHTPALFSELTLLSNIPLDVCGKLSTPKEPITSRRGRKSAARVTMPKAPVNKDGCLVAWKNNVRRPR